MLNSETKPSAGRRRAGTVIGPPDAPASTSSAPPPIIRHRLRNVQGGTSISASFISGQFSPQVMVRAINRTMPPGASDPLAVRALAASLDGPSALGATRDDGSVPAPGSALMARAPTPSEIGAPAALFRVAVAGRLRPLGPADIGHGRPRRVLGPRRPPRFPSHGGVGCARAAVARSGHGSDAPTRS